MPDFTPYTRANLEKALTQIGHAVYTPVAELSIAAWRTPEPVPFAKRQTGDTLHLKIGDAWGKLFDCAWFHFTGQVPPEAEGQPVVLLLDVSGEMLAVDSQGMPLRGLTNMASEFDYTLGRPGKRVFSITERAQGGEDISLWADAGCNDLFGFLKHGGTIKEAYIAVCHEPMRALYYDFEVLMDCLRVLPSESPRFHQILTALSDAAWEVAPGLTDPSVIDDAANCARATLRPMLEKRGGDPSLRISAIGHAHIDLGWLWPIRETKRKGARTFATVLANMEHYPDYHFGASQPQLFQWIKEEYPELYEKVKQRVAEGRFEPQGVMWVEADTNLSGGEALVRQVLEGRRFFREEFGVTPNYLWLPDVFGYSGALPQILKKSGVDYFMTQKMSWNQVNTFPHHSFHWQGIDGSAVLAHMLAEETYNSPAAPRSVGKIESNYKDKGISEHSLMLYGIGDGGGGPGEEHLERLARIHNLAGLSPVTQEPAAQFFAKWSKDAARFPTWEGELYLERHAGTLTTEAKNKWYNRRMEQLLREVEWSLVMSGGASGVPYPKERLRTIWREILLYQFHDILPGSSIKRVYVESLIRYAELQHEIENLICQSEEATARQTDTSALASPALVFNALSWPRQEWIKVDNRWLHADVPAMGYRALDVSAPQDLPALAAEEALLENDLLRVRFGEDGSIISVYDKGLNREVIADGQQANRLAVYLDPGDAWDFPLDYAKQTPKAMQLVSSTPQIDGPRAVLVQVYRTGNSQLTQEISLTAGSRCLSFDNRLRWRETRTMLRVSFPLAIHADEAAYEIQFGHIRRATHRNTTWDLAKDEVVAHKWADLSQRDYGVALLNDSKYGYKIKGNTIDLNLLRSVPYPGQNEMLQQAVQPGEPHPGYTDQAEHVFRYALYPHPGDIVSGGVIQAGYEFNHPLRTIRTDAHPGPRPAAFSMFTIDAPNVIVEAVKQAEDDGATVIRLYESSSAATRATVRFSAPLLAAFETNLMEENPRPLEIRDNTVTLAFGPFEIKTVMIQNS